MYKSENRRDDIIASPSKTLHGCLVSLSSSRKGKNWEEEGGEREKVGDGEVKDIKEGRKGKMKGREGGGEKRERKGEKEVEKRREKM